MSKNWENVCDELGWSVVECDDGTIEFSKTSSAGEDFSFYIEGGDSWAVALGVAEAWTSFDPDEHAAMWYEAKKSGVAGVPSLSVLVQDAVSIESDLQNLSLALDRVA